MTNKPKGITKRGYISKTKNQRKMHYTQLSSQNLADLYEALVANAKSATPKMSRHLSYKIARGEISFTREQFLSAISTPNNIIEVNVTKGKLRLLFRSSKAYLVTLNSKEVLANLCVVIDLDTLDIITAYYNSTSDTHDTLIADRYTVFDIYDYLKKEE